MNNAGFIRRAYICRTMIRLNIRYPNMHGIMGAERVG